MRPARLAEHTTHISGRRDDLKGKLEAILVTEGPLVWEVGCGHGHFLTAYAKAHPDQVCVGVDIMSDRVIRAHRKRERAKLGHLHFIRADAEDFLAVMPAQSRFASVYVLFPDPWPKRRHHKNRVMNAHFLTAVATRSSRETRLFFRTDHEDYFDGASAVLKDHPDWIVEPESQLPFEEPTVFQKRSDRHFTLVARRR